ncbi:hypothetical protein PR202_gb25911 [Eleusine coracana subsp. coracana]|uniref:Uncharacterized protein n=1 Tax=Eleusine coracana subsp. coracana TaxID=191504 RepID=A0AAV5FMP8_ELECO|nr:hypothetical protein PR202_gb25911 [Eleusine coracana subsp. coracana]
MLQGTVNLSHNEFSSSIPANLDWLLEKVYIDLTYNNLSRLILQSGALENRDPMPFLGKVGLYGPQFKNPCSPDIVSDSLCSTCQIRSCTSMLVEEMTKLLDPLLLGKPIYLSPMAA